MLDCILTTNVFPGSHCVRTFPCTPPAMHHQICLSGCVTMWLCVQENLHDLHDKDLQIGGALQLLSQVPLVGTIIVDCWQAKTTDAVHHATNADECCTCIGSQFLSLCGKFSAIFTSIVNVRLCLCKFLNAGEFNLDIDGEKHSPTPVVVKLAFPWPLSDEDVSCGNQ